MSRRADHHFHHQNNVISVRQHQTLKNMDTKLQSVIDNTNSINLNTDTLEDKLTNGTAIVKAMGSTTGQTDGTQKQLKTDGNGVVMSSVVNTLNIQPSNSTNSHITDDPANSVCVGLTGRQVIGTATSQTHLLCDSSGKLEVNNSSNSTALSGIQGTLTDAETHLSAVDTNIVNIRDAINAIKIFNQDAELHLSAIDTNISNRLPSTIGPKDESLSLTISRNNTPGAFSMNARTNITDRATEKFLLCSSDGKLNVLNSEFKEYGSIQTLEASLSVPNGGNNDSSLINNNKLTDEYKIQVECGDNTYTDFNAEILESIDGTNFKSTFILQQGLTPSFFIMESIHRLSPIWKVRINNTGASTKNFIIKYVKAE